MKLKGIKTKGKEFWNLNDALIFQGAKGFFIDDETTMRAKDSRPFRYGDFKGFRAIFKKKVRR